MRFTLARFVDYILTQSNVSAAVGEGRGDARAVRAWFTATLGSLFGDGERSLAFGGYIWYLRLL